MPKKKKKSKMVPTLGAPVVCPRCQNKVKTETAAKHGGCCSASCQTVMDRVTPPKKTEDAPAEPEEQVFLVALCKLGNGIIDMRGKFGGVYFKRGTDGQHVQALPRRVRYTTWPNSGAQERGILKAKTRGFGSGLKGFLNGVGMFSAMAGIWLAILLLAMGVLWSGFALHNLYVDKTGRGKKISGYNWFMHFALAGEGGNQLPFWKPPHAQHDRPDFYVVYKGRWMYDHAPEEWPDETPSDYYWLIGELNGKNWYATDNRRWNIFWDGSDWCMTQAPGEWVPDVSWKSVDDEPFGYYQNPDTGSFSHVYNGKLIY